MGVKWRILCHLGIRKKILISNVSGTIRIAPLLILVFPLLAPKKLFDAQKFNLTYTNPSEITEIADKLRWYRYKKALLQRDVADYAGIELSTYTGYEEYGRDYYPIEHMIRIAELFEVPVDELLDDYNCFLNDDPGMQIKLTRERLELTQKQYAEQLGVSLDKLKNWELGRVRVSKRTWERCFRSSAAEKTE